MPIHRQKIFVNKNLKNAKVELAANRDHWRQWYHVANAFQNKTSAKSYADVLKSTKGVTFSQKHNAQSPQLRRIVPKLKVHSTNKLGTDENTKKPLPARTPVLTKPKSLVLTNRFQILQQEEPENTVVNPGGNNPLATAKNFSFTGNKNGKGSKLGQAVTVERLGTHFKGNKNKTGKKMGDDSTANDEDYQCDLNVSVTQETKQMATIAEAPDFPIPSPLQQSQPFGDEITHVIKHRKKCIPDTVKWEQIYSKDYNRSIFQNKARFGFIPYNDLLLYTGEDVVWGEVPNMVEAHTLIRKSGLPNYLGMRIPVTSQLNIPVWQKYLTSY